MRKNKNLVNHTLDSSNKRGAKMGILSHSSSKSNKDSSFNTSTVPEIPNGSTIGIAYALSRKLIKNVGYKHYQDRLKNNKA